MKMQRVVIMVFAIAHLLWPVHAEAKDYFAIQDTASIKVLSYNIHHCNPPSKAKVGLIDVEGIARVIRESGADLVALQEVDVNTERSGKGINQAKELGRLTGMHYFFVKNIDHQGGDYGVAVLSKFPIIDSLGLKLPMKEGIGGEPRGVAAVVVEPEKGKKILFASTHFDLKEPTRVLQAAEINRVFKKRKEIVIVAGDFNALPDSEVIKTLDKQFVRSCTESCGFTIPEVKPNRTIDFIMSRKKDKLRTISHKVISEPYASDHLPVFAEFY